MTGSGTVTLMTIAHIRTDFPEKFGIPRQSGLVPELMGTIIFEPEYRNPDALRGLEGYDYIWLLWGFQGTERAEWSPTVRPPRLGGNRRMGVFATRSPFRPNPIGLSSVKLEEIGQGADGPFLQVSGIDMRDGTPIYDIKPYLPYVDSHADARGGFSDARVQPVDTAGGEKTPCDASVCAADRDGQIQDAVNGDGHLCDAASGSGCTQDGPAYQFRTDALEVEFPEHLLALITPQKRQVLTAVLKQDPRPHYQQDPGRVYGMAFDRYNVQFIVNGNCLRVTGVMFIP